MFRLQEQASVLRLHQAILHDVRHAHAGVQPDDTRRAFQRVRGAHAGFQLVGLGRAALQRHQAGVEHLGLGLRLEPEQLEQRRVSHLVGVMPGSALRLAGEGLRRAG